MHNDNKLIAQAYYTAMAEKNITDLAQYLDPNVLFVAPLAKVAGKQAFVETVTKFVTFFSKLTIRSTFGSFDQAMVVYTLDFPESIGKVETAALLQIQDGLITKIELFMMHVRLIKNNKITNRKIYFGISALTPVF